MLNTVTLTWDLTDFIQEGLQCRITLVPNVVIEDATDHVTIPEVTRGVQFSGGTGELAGIIACDNTDLLPQGWAYTLTVFDNNGRTIVGPELVFINYGDGAVQDLSTLVALVAPPVLAEFLPIPAGTPAAGDVPEYVGPGLATQWGPGGGGGGSYDPLGSAATAQANAEAFATSAVGAETARAEAAEGGMLRSANNLSDVFSASTARSNLGLGSAATQPSSAFDAAGAAASAQSTAETFATAAVAGETSRAETAEGAALQKANNLSDLANASTARTNLGLGSAATQPTSAFDAAGAATTAQTNAETFATSAVGTETTRAEAAEAAAQAAAEAASVPVTSTQTASTQTLWSFTPNQSATPSPYSIEVETQTFGSPAVTETNLSIGYNVAGYDSGSGGDIAGVLKWLPYCGDTKGLEWEFAGNFPDNTGYMGFQMIAAHDGTDHVTWTHKFYSGTNQAGSWILVDGSVSGAPAYIEATTASAVAGAGNLQFPQKTLNMAGQSNGGASFNIIPASGGTQVTWDGVGSNANVSLSMVSGTGTGFTSLTMDSSAGTGGTSVYLNAASTGANAINFRRSGTTSWTLYDAGGTTLYFRDQTNGVMALQISPGSGTTGQAIFGGSVQAKGRLVVGTAALATNATDGFLYFPTCAGAPTGTPGTQNAAVACVFDTTDNQLWIYTGGAWKAVTLS